MLWKTKLKDAVRTGVGKSKERIGLLYGFCLYWWSMGAVEKKLQEELIMLLKQTSFVMISKSGGARMMEGLDAISKTSVKLAQLSRSNFLTFLCTDPTTGGTTASYAMLGDNISEPGALMDLQDLELLETLLVKIYQKVFKLLNLFRTWFLDLLLQEKN
jgi:acetyl-CoA carboxylase carboxyl transferase subunit beta